MKTFITTMMAALVYGATLAASDPAREQKLQQAIDLLESKGDVAKAAPLFEDVAKSSDKALAARALLYLGRLQEQQDRAKALKTYERIVREFADQKEEVALARARLGAATVVTSGKSERPVWTGPHIDFFGRVSPDGRFITYVGWSDGRLMLHDVAANVDRALTPLSVPNYSQQALWSAISRDGRQIVYEWSENANSDHPARVGFRIAALPGSGFVDPRQFFVASEDVRSVDVFDWSPDGKWIAAALRRTDGTGQIALIAVADGSFRVLKSFADWNARSQPFFSPDSRYITYDLPAGDGIAQRDVFVLGIDSSRETPAVVHSANDKAIGWSPDGTRLLFSSDRAGSVGVWALPFADGKTQGSPQLIKSDLASSDLGLTASGALYVFKAVNTRDIAIAPIDLEAGRLLEPAVSFDQGFVDGTKNPVWSPDGRHLSYYACGNGGEDVSCLVIRSVATGEARRLPRTMASSIGSSWSPDGQSLIVRGTDLKGRQGIFQLNAQTGEATAVILSDGLVGRARWSPDGKKVYFTRGASGVVERDMASGVERDIKGVLPLGLSPDGQYFEGGRQDPSTKTASVLLVPVAGGQPRELLRLTQPEVPRGRVWTPDSRALIVTKDTGSGLELWLVSVTGGPPRKLDIDPNIWMEGSKFGNEDQGFSLSPDGRRIAFVMGKRIAEISVLENFLPVPEK